MRHTSVKLDTPCEFINITPVNPLISKCQIKVCYVGEEPNRNRSVITKETATKMAASLPGSPIVGFYNECEEDFEEHNRSISIVDGKFVSKDTTRPYGFVDMNAKVWFQKFLDDGVNEREYLMTEGFLWTGQYPEAKRIVDAGNNQSMELDENYLDAFWTKDGNGNPQFFIINEAIISKLCVLGEDYEPCFEGASIAKIEFSFEDSFKQQLYSMIKQVSELLNKEGGEKAMNKDFSLAEENNLSVTEEENVEVESLTPTEESQFALEEEAEVEEEIKEEEVEEKEAEEVSEPEALPEEEVEEISTEEDSDEPVVEEVEEEEKIEEVESETEEITEEEVKSYNLEDISEYVELSKNYIKLESEFNALTAEKVELEKEIETLKEFKLSTERKEKESMINETFYMLSEEEKADVKENIDKYSLEDIEAKLSVICVRNKVFNLDSDNEEKEEATIVYSLDDDTLSSSTPAWVSAALEVAKKIK